MKAVIFIIPFLILFLAGIQYVVGRILLPEMGLEAPSYGIWLLATSLYALAHAAIEFMKEAMS